MSHGCKDWCAGRLPGVIVLWHTELAWQHFNTCSRPRLKVRYRVIRRWLLRLRGNVVHPLGRVRRILLLPLRNLCVVGVKLQRIRLQWRRSILLSLWVPKISQVLSRVFIGDWFCARISSCYHLRLSESFRYVASGNFSGIQRIGECATRWSSGASDKKSWMLIGPSLASVIHSTRLASFEPSRRRIEDSVSRRRRWGWRCRVDCQIF